MKSIYYNKYNPYYLNHYISNVFLLIDVCNRTYTSDPRDPYLKSNNDNYEIIFIKMM